MTKSHVILLIGSYVLWANLGLFVGHQIWATPDASPQTENVAVPSGELEFIDRRESNMEIPIQAEKVQKYRFRPSKPMMFEALQFTGTNSSDILRFCPTAREFNDGKSGIIISGVGGEKVMRSDDWLVKEPLWFRIVNNGWFRQDYEVVK